MIKTHPFFVEAFAPLFLIAGGEFYLVQTVLAGRVWLRTALMNPFTGESQLRSLMEAVVESAARVRSS